MCVLLSGDVSTCTWLKNSCSKQSSQGSATDIGLASLEMSLTFIMIFISCTQKTQHGAFYLIITEIADLRSEMCFTWRWNRREHLYHFFVLLVGEVELRLQTSELSQDVVVSHHVGGQNASERDQYISFIYYKVKRGQEVTSPHLIMPPRMSL